MEAIDRPAWSEPLDAAHLKATNATGKRVQLEHLPFSREEQKLEAAASAVIHALNIYDLNKYLEEEAASPIERLILTQLSQTVADLSCEVPGAPVFLQPNDNRIMDLYSYATQVADDPLQYLESVRQEAAQYITNHPEPDAGSPTMFDPNVLTYRIMTTIVVLSAESGHFTNISDAA